MRSGWTKSMVVAVGLLSMGLAACDESPNVVTQDAYDDEAIRLCERHGENLVPIEEIEARNESDAAKAAFLAGEMVPAARAIVRSLDGFGYPQANRVDYRQGAVDAFEALAELEEDALNLLDRRRGGLIVEDEDPFVDLSTGLAAMDIPCWSG